MSRFTRETFPEKWWIKSNIDTYRVLYEYINNNTTSEKRYNYKEYYGSTDINTELCFPAVNYYNIGIKHQCKGDKTYVEITFEEFEKFVLIKENICESLDYLVSLLHKLGIK